MNAVTTLTSKISLLHKLTMWKRATAPEATPSFWLRGLLPKSWILPEKKNLREAADTLIQHYNWDTPQVGGVYFTDGAGGQFWS